MNLKPAIITTILLSFVSAPFFPFVRRATHSRSRIFTRTVHSVLKGFGPVRWMKDSKGYSTVETNKHLGGEEIVRYDAQTGDAFGARDGKAACS